jgi:hypothetical protein
VRIRRPDEKVGCGHPYRVTTATGVFERRCGSKDYEYCPSCARTYYFDMRRIAMDGVINAPEGSEFWVIALTQPSHGDVHLVPARHHDGENEDTRCKCKLPHARCDHDLRGVPIPGAAYRYNDQFEFNYSMGPLWTATVRRLRAKCPSLAYFLVSETQRRGAEHFHVILRVSKKDVHDTTAQFVEAILGASATTHWGNKIQWGVQVHVARLRRLDVAREGGVPHELTELEYVEDAVSYILKDITAGRLDGEGQLGDHLKRLDVAAYKSKCPRCLKVGDRCRDSCHRRFGAHGPRVRYSYNRIQAAETDWSPTRITQKSLREARRDFARERAENESATAAA